ncbi:hypothetical protein APV28_1269 [Comamonas testosteroni]|nr:hypothetical protein APV28_1269 [Comamonas testosteroni]
MTADGGDGGYVGRESAGSAGVTAVEGQHADGSGFCRFFLAGAARGGGGDGIQCHGAPQFAPGNARVGAGVVTRYNRCILCEAPLSCD